MRRIVALVLAVGLCAGHAPAQTTSAEVSSALQAIGRAPDAAAATAAYTQACNAGAPVEDSEAALVRALVALGRPELAEAQARDLIGRDSKEPLAWAAGAATLVAKGNVLEALPLIARAGDLNDREPFVMRTAARVIAAIDVLQPTVSDKGRAQVTTLRHNMKGEAVFDAEYASASAEFRAQAAVAAGPAAVEAPAPQVVVIESAPAAPPPPQIVVVHDAPRDERILPVPIVTYAQPNPYASARAWWTTGDGLLLGRERRRDRFDHPVHSRGGPLFGAADFGFGTRQPPVPPALVAPRAAGTLAAPALPMIQPRPATITVTASPPLRSAPAALPPPPRANEHGPGGATGGTGHHGR